MALRPPVAPVRHEAIRQKQKSRGHGPRLCLCPAWRGAEAPRPNSALCLLRGGSGRLLGGGLAGGRLRRGLRSNGGLCSCGPGSGRGGSLRSGSGRLGGDLRRSLGRGLRCRLGSGLRCRLGSGLRCRLGSGLRCRLGSGLRSGGSHRSSSLRSSGLRSGSLRSGSLRSSGLRSGGLRSGSHRSGGLRGSLGSSRHRLRRGCLHRGLRGNPGGRGSGLHRGLLGGGRLLLTSHGHLRSVIWDVIWSIRIMRQSAQYSRCTEAPAKPATVTEWLGLESICPAKCDRRHSRTAFYSRHGTPFQQQGQPETERRSIPAGALGRHGDRTAFQSVQGRRHSARNHIVDADRSQRRQHAAIAVALVAAASPRNDARASCCRGQRLSWETAVPNDGPAPLPAGHHRSRSLPKRRWRAPSGKRCGMHRRDRGATELSFARRIASPRRAPLPSKPS